MRVIDGNCGLPKVQFGNVGRGEPFYYRDRLYLKGSARLEANRLQTCGGMMTPFAFDVDNGEVIPLQNETEVIPAKAHVIVEAIGRFS